MLNKLLLVDDNAATNFIHKKILAKEKCAKEIIDFQMGHLALEYLSDEGNTLPELLFVDINMPTMDAWEFIQEYVLLKRENLDKIKIFLLTTSLIPQDQQKIANLGSTVNGILMKPLNTESIQEVLSQHF